MTSFHFFQNAHILEMSENIGKTALGRLSPKPHWGPRSYEPAFGPHAYVAQWRV